MSRRRGSRRYFQPLRARFRATIAAPGVAPRVCPVGLHRRRWQSRSAMAGAPGRSGSSQGCTRVWRRARSRGVRSGSGVRAALSPAQPLVASSKLGNCTREPECDLSLIRRQPPVAHWHPVLCRISALRTQVLRRKERLEKPARVSPFAVGPSTDWRRDDWISESTQRRAQVHRPIHTMVTVESCRYSSRMRRIT